MGLTTEQEQMVKEAFGAGEDWPKATGDPRVNHRVDQLVQQLAKLGPIPDWDFLAVEEQQLYIEEATLNRQAGL